ncbi:tetratricopeptide repeat protein [Amycolatopsis sp. Hca4]|uniref:tetratricopeptide repeat protein n=1 Tax=Amycolatopsis sp. Hca4 TaxID=2742131 RepID=UPI0015905F45|nr:tetratricopeptide repeat protein [Amycolatopsis sp. Hca4]QKV80393.1 tetratricopeptide repeat protein [Amycolatopsis sp. Hca4]
MASDDDRTVAETLRERLNRISEIVEEYITDDGLEARLRVLKARSGYQVPRGSARFIGRRALLDDLLALTRGSQRKPAVLTGAGGMGKTTVAAALAEHVRARGGRVWWISAVDPVALSQGLMTVARQMGAAPHDVEAIARGTADAADRFWKLLDRVSPEWLLVFDEADDPRVLATGTSPAGIQDLTGWVRSSAHGLALVTSRETDPRMWEAARILSIGALDENDAARILRELAPTAGDEDQARALARRLDGHPLSLHLAGSHLRSRTTRRATFAAYEPAIGGTVGSGRRARAAAAVTGTPAGRAVEMSLDELAQRGFPQARPVLQLASCYASTAIPEGLLDAGFLSGPPTSRDNTPPIRHLDEALRGLREVGLIDFGSPGGIVVHPVVRAVGRASLDGPEPHPGWVRHTAVALLAADVAGLPHDRPAAWPEYALLGPHLLSLLETTAQQVDREHLIQLLETAARMAWAFNLSGAGRAGSVLCERALAHSAELGNGHLTVLRLRHMLAWAVADRGDLAGAESLYQDVLRNRLRQLTPEHPDVLRCRHELAWIAGCGKEWAKAEKGYRAVLRDSVGVLDSDDPDILITRHELGWAIANQGRLDEAQAVLRAVLEDRMRVLGPTHQRTLGTQHELAWITAKEGKWAQAETGYRDLLDLRAQLLGADHPETLVIRHELAWIAAGRGQPVEAEAGYRDVLDRRRRVLGEDHPDTRATAVALEELRHGRIVDARHSV